MLEDDEKCARGSIDRKIEVLKKRSIVVREDLFEAIPVFLVDLH